MLFCKELTLKLSNNILDCAKLESFADEKLNISLSIKFMFDRTGKNVGKRKVVIKSIFLFFFYNFLKNVSPQGH